MKELLVETLGELVGECDEQVLLWGVAGVGDGLYQPLPVSC